LTAIPFAKVFTSPLRRARPTCELAGIFLTLHGGSGIEDENFRRAIAAGINIIHVNTELRVAWRESLEENLTREPNEAVPSRILRPNAGCVL
jgi:fructose/tagatose bisphosphate aldolase